MSSEPEPVPPAASGLKKISPYWYPYTTMAKERWLGREILEVVSTEFRDRSMEYYRYALESGVTTINGKVARPDTIVCNGDRIENIVHRHEPPVTATPVKVILHDKERNFIVVDKPGSIPVHASGRYFRNTLVGILENEFGYEKVYTVNRLDRLTSGLMILPLTVDLARVMTEEFTAGTIRKEYIARVKGEFPAEEFVCEAPLLTVDRQMGLNIVHPQGKNAKTVFNRVRYDANTDSSVVHCQPLTGRSHQLRVHLQYLGFPIANDPVYSDAKIWGEGVGKGGLDVNPSDERAAPRPPSRAEIKLEGNPESLSGLESGGRQSRTRTSSETAQETTKQEDPTSTVRPKLLPRETGHDIGMGSPVPLSSEAVQVITRLRNMKDEDEDWSRWRDVVFRAKGALSPRGMKIKKQPPHKRRRGQAEFEDPSRQDNQTDGRQDVESSTQLTTEEALSRLDFSHHSDAGSVGTAAGEARSRQSDGTYCPECYLPLHPDPKAEKLFIFLHALRYTTSLGSFETEMPEWSKEGWEWDRD